MAWRRVAEAAGAEVLAGSFLDFLDPWGNRVQVVGYRHLQFTEADHLLPGVGLDVAKSESAIEQLREKGMAPER